VNVYFGVLDTVEVATATAGAPLAILVATAIIGVLPSLPSFPAGPEGPGEPVGPGEPPGI